MNVNVNVNVKYVEPERKMLMRDLEVEVMSNSCSHSTVKLMQVQVLWGVIADPANVERSKFNHWLLY